MIKKKHFFDRHDGDEIDKISTIFSSSIKTLKFSGSSHYAFPSQKYYMFTVCGSLCLKDLLPLKVVLESKPRYYVFRSMNSLKSEYNGLFITSQIDCINIKNNSDKYSMQLVFRPFFK